MGDDEWHDFSNASAFEVVTAAVQDAFKTWWPAHGAGGVGGSDGVGAITPGGGGAMVASVPLPTAAAVGVDCKLTLFRRPRHDVGAGTALFFCG